MRFAVISDTHLGDPECTLATMDSSGNVHDGRNLEELFKVAGTDNDFFIILGDMMDFAINDYGDVYKIAQHFFKRVQEAHLLKPQGNIIYVPGNHDYNIWHTIEHEANVINRMKNGKPLRKFRMSVPLVLDDRTKSSHALNLQGVFRHSGEQGYGGMFLDSIISPRPEDQINFVIPFPNIYFANDQETVIMTHGQYFETYWSATSELYQIITEHTDILSMKDFIAVNFPLGELGSSGVGQAGPLTDTILEIEKDVSSGKCELTETYVKRLIPILLKRFDIPLVPNRLEKLMYEGICSVIMQELKKVRDSNFIHELQKDKDTQNRVTRFLDSSMQEINEILSKGDIPSGIKAPDTILFGHTHQPVIASDQVDFNYNGKSIKLLNTGGWLNVSGSDADRYGGEVFLYESGQGFSSQKISVAH